MIRSMTGFGTASVSSPLGEVSVEIKSLNNRFLDLSVKLPREASSLELKVRDLVKKRLRRGKVDLYVRYIPSPDASGQYEINENVLRGYAKQVQAAFAGDSSFDASKVDIGALLQLPGVVSPAAFAGEESPLLAVITEAIEKALGNVEKAREIEGQALADAIRSHVHFIEEQTQAVMQVKDDLLNDYRVKLKERIEVLGKTLEATLDPVRVETEIMFYADKSDITEELVRLAAHFKSFRDMLDNPGKEPLGKSMDFLVQELLRETNTIGNKARGVSVASKIVSMKSEIEKIREQVQNIE